MNLKLVLLLSALAGVAADVLHAQGTTASDRPTTGTADTLRIQFEGAEVPMSLRDVVVTAFEQNLDMEIRSMEEGIAADVAAGERGIYDPTLTAGTQLAETDAQSASVRPGARNRSGNETDIQSTNTYTNAGISQLLPTGGTVAVGAQNDRTYNHGPYFGSTGGASINAFTQARAFISVRQPLLKNLGPEVTNNGIRVADREREAAEALYRQEVIDQTAAVMQAYWEVVFAIRNLEVQRAALDSALELERVNRVRVETGASPRADLLQAQAQASLRRSQVIAAKSQILDAQDRLLRILNWNKRGDGWSRPIIPSDSPSQYDLALTLEDEPLIGEAIERRPDLRAAELGTDVARLNRDVAKWQRLPQLDAFAEYGWGGYERNAQSAFQEVMQNDYEDYAVGLEFRYPLLNRRARADYRRSQKTLQRNELVRDSTELMIVAEVRAATRLIRTAQESIEASEAQVTAARETLQVERRRLEVGGSTTFNVLRFQEDLAEAEVNQVRALVDFQQGVIELERARGTLLDQLGRELNVTFDFPSSKPEPRVISTTTK